MSHTNFEKDLTAHLSVQNRSKNNANIPVSLTFFSKFKVFATHFEKCDGTFVHCGTQVEKHCFLVTLEFDIFFVSHYC
jgi:hypothetical protein